MNARTRRWLLVGVALVIVGAALLVVTHHGQRRTTLRIATGQQGGTWLPLGEDLAAAFASDVPRVDPRAVPSPGSDSSIAMLERGEVELALVSSNSKPVERVRLVAPLYGEVLHIVVKRSAGVSGIAELADKQVSIGPVGSGTEAIARQVFAHFGVAPKGTQNLTPLEAADRLEAGTLDAAFLVAGLRAPVIARLLARSDMTLLSLGDPDRRGSAIEGIGIDAPYLLPAVIPELAYGSVPARAVGTIGVKALLVARKDLDNDLIYDLTAALFNAKVRLVEHERLLAHMTEKFDAAEAPFPLHAGADRYLRRDDPSLISEYTDQISLALTVAAILWSGIAGLAAWRRNRQRGRIETYFSRLAAIVASLRTAGSEDARQAARARLDALEIEALEELAAERLEAGPSFLVLQEGLRRAEQLTRDDSASAAQQ